MRYVIKNENGTYTIPADESKINYLAEITGGIVIPESEVIVNEYIEVPVYVERYQARVALHNAGLLEQVESIMADESTDIVAREAWNGSSVIRRDSVTVASFIEVLGLTSEQADNLFIAASRIEG